MAILVFYSNIMELSKSYNLPNFVPNNLDKTKISRYKDIMKQKYITQWRYSVNYTRKLELCYFSVLMSQFLFS